MDWQRLADLDKPVSNFTFTALKSSLTLFSGENRSGEPNNQVYLYDIEQDRWSHGPKLSECKSEAVITNSDHTF